MNNNVGVEFTQVTMEESHIYLLTSKLHGQLGLQIQAGKGEPKAQGLLAEEVVPKVTSRICGLPFLVQIAPLLSRTELVTATPLLVDASHCTPKSNVKRFIRTRPKPAYGRQGLDWIIGPGYSFVVFSTNRGI